MEDIKISRFSIPPLYLPNDKEVVDNQKAKVRQLILEYKKNHPEDELEYIVFADKAEDVFGDHKGMIFLNVIGFGQQLK